MSRALSWILGAALLSAVIVTALHFSEARAFAGMLEAARPGWLAVAVALQVATYVAQAEVFRSPPRAAGHILPRPWLYQLSIVKLFMDQALPSAGISSIVITSRALEARGLPRAITAATALLNIATYHAGYIACLVPALALMTARHALHPAVLGVSLLFIAFSAAMTGGILILAGTEAALPRWLSRVRPLSGAAQFVADADRRLARTPHVLGAATAWQCAIFLLDAATMWSLIRAVGAAAPLDLVYASFMISSLFRTMGVVPGGLGTFEATSVITLAMGGVTVPVALAATLLFRGLSFWLPMIPGFYLSHRLARQAGTRIGGRTSRGSRGAPASRTSPAVHRGRPSADPEPS